MADEPSFHRLLATQLETLELSPDQPPSEEQWRDFLTEIDDAYERRTEGAVILDKNFDNLIAHAVDAFILHDTKGNVVEANKAACEMLGYTREEMLAMRVADFEMELDPGAIWDDMTVDEVFTVDGTHRRKDGTTYPVETRVGAFIVDGQKIVLALCRDITERKAAEEKLKRLNERLQSARDEAIRANHAKSTFLANMSHELRTPLNAVIGYSEFMIEEMQDEGEELYVPDLERILTAGRHLLTLINDILDLSKIEAGKVELDVSSFELSELLDDIDATVRPLAQKNNNELTLELGDELSGTQDGHAAEMRSDITKIRQILFNLISNACKFTNDGEVTVRATAQSGGEAVRFSVSDSGVGMTEDELERVFKAFQQADASTTRKFGGTGLGLAITRHYCRMLGGSIDVESTPGEGTTFTVILPLDASLHAEQPHEQSSVEVEPLEADGGGRLRETVLVIEDDESARDLLRRTLRAEGYRVVTATNGSQGLHLARELEPLAITLDLLMPEMDGWQVLSRLKRDEQLADIPVILVSMLDERKRGFALGADHYLVKPLERERLVDMLAGYRTNGVTDGLCLIVEDDGPTRELMERIISKEGWRVQQAENGRLGLDAARAEAPDLVILDLMMPEVDGFEFLAEFRQETQFEDIPVVVVTAKELTDAEVDNLAQATTQIILKAGRGAGELLAEVRRSLRKLA
ncbi:MAG: response regulator [Persicimonas sp.]